MPPKTPIGTPTTLAIASSSMVPTMALAMPPPSSPVGFGSWVKKFQSSELAPCFRRKYVTRNRGAMTAPAQMTSTTVTAVLFILRQRANPGVGRKGEASIASGDLDRAAAGHALQHDLGEDVHRYRDAEKHQPQLEQRVEVEVARRLGKLVGDH